MHQPVKSSIRAERTELLSLGCKSHNIHTFLGADIYGSRYNKSNHCKKEFFSSEKSFSSTGFPSHVLDMTGSTFPHSCVLIWPFQQHITGAITETLSICTTLPSSSHQFGENRAKSNTECLIQTEKLGGKRKKEREFTPLGCYPITFCDCITCASFQRDHWFQHLLRVYREKPELSFTL